ncbi:toll/interleukin-1 receptor domain-containing protein, partial [Kitasatospora sp. NPDC007106]|uniref:tetratricopeptide repeat protein n=1 Tax=Kitasatospora sp. NPDC007106 TaxID=3156914 RepID=UPI0033E2C435
MFFSYPRADRARVLPLVAALRAAGVGVFLDEARIDEFAGITDTIRAALRGARIFVAYYSAAYPSRPACQWELLTAFRAATALGEPTSRIVVLNPEPGPDHIQPVQLADARYAILTEGEPTEGEAATRIAQRIRELLERAPGCLGDVIEERRPVWRPTEHAGSERFVGRVAEFWQLHTALHAPEYPATQDAASSGQAVVTGLGGVGKTLLVEQYARRFAAFYPGGIYWFTAAASHAPDAAADTAAARAEVLAQHSQQVAAALAVDPAQSDPAQIRDIARGRLERAGAPCLWVVDDLPGALTPEILRELAAPHPLGRTLMTTRWRGYQLPSVDLDVLHYDEAHQLLTGARTLIGDQEEAAAHTLAARLGYHALALDLARGCLADQPGLTYTDLLTELADTQAGDAFQRLVDDLVTQVPTGHTRDIAATFTRSLRHLDADTLTLLRLAATLASAPLPELLLAAVNAAYHGTDEDTARRANLRALSTARRRSLIRPTAGQSPAWFLHALVGRTLLLDDATASARPALRQAALTATTDLMKLVHAPGRLDHLADIAPHARALTEELDTPEVLDLLGAVARYDYETGQSAGAARTYERLVEARTAALGPAHPNTLTSRNNLASAYQTAGDLGRAVPLSEQTLAARRRVLGE